MEAGDFGHAQALLNQSRARDLQAAKQLQEIAHKRLLSAAVSTAAIGNLKMTQLVYAEAAEYFCEAADILGSDAEELRADYLNAAGVALVHAGKYAEAEPLYQRALATREQGLGSQHPKVATSLNNLASLYREQGKYAEAEPLYQRALAILMQALGLQHPNTITVLKNYDAMRQMQSGILKPPR